LSSLPDACARCYESHWVPRHRRTAEPVGVRGDARRNAVGTMMRSTGFFVSSGSKPLRALIALGQVMGTPNKPVSSMGRISAHPSGRLALRGRGGGIYAVRRPHSPAKCPLTLLILLALPKGSNQCFRRESARPRHLPRCRRLGRSLKPRVLQIVAS
jgi:hypothetical protein